MCLLCFFHGSVASPPMECRLNFFGLKKERALTPKVWSEKSVSLRQTRAGTAIPFARAWGTLPRDRGTDWISGCVHAFFAFLTNPSAHVLSSTTGRFPPARSLRARELATTPSSGEPSAAQILQATLVSQSHWVERTLGTGGDLRR